MVFTRLTRQPETPAALGKLPGNGTVKPPDSLSNL